MTDTTLDGATQRGPANTYPANAGEFAARWNAKPDAERDEWVRFMVDEAAEAQRATFLALDLARRVEALVAHNNELRALLSLASWEFGLDGRLGNLLAPYRVITTEEGSSE